MNRMGQGLTDKLYWRRTSPGRWHCFKKADLARWEALCASAIAIGRSDGQDSRRPPSLLRCPVCDGAEAKRRGWDVCGVDRVGYHDAKTFKILPILKSPGLRPDPLGAVPPDPGFTPSEVERGQGERRGRGNREDTSREKR